MIDERNSIAVRHVNHRFSESSVPDYEDVKVSSKHALFN